eukprot:TRINITY_DN13074_c0_g1_i1.p2 TRINITY_DN13074_c0_g1~~TRINITY_DN13074_c0_g1_i1.p2  ORF type:complete len:104 (-),score=14.91 TRINITY_DN13074_c0_g1_i1:36-347(-)
MGGDHHHDEARTHPKRVWSPGGGMGNYQPQWRQRSVIGLGVMFAVSFFTVYFYGRHVERRYRDPLVPVPSQRWCTHTLEDTPNYPQQLREYKKNKLSLWDRIF